MSKPIFSSLNKKCKKCGSNKTYTNPKNGKQAWYYANTGFLCKKCYNVMENLK